MNSIFTDEEHRILLSAISRERKVCEECDRELDGNDGYALVPIVDSIERKVSGAIADGIIKTFHEVAKGNQNEEVQMLCNVSNVINMRIYEILQGGKDDGGN